MHFNTLIKTNIAPILQKYGFEISEELENILRFQSLVVEISIVYNRYEMSNTLWIGKRGVTKGNIEIDNETLKQFFHSDLKLSEVPLEVFVENLVLFFKNEANSILKGNTRFLEALEKYHLERCEKYTDKLIEEQNLKIADTAWENKNYQDFIKVLDKINKLHLPQSYYLKYKIALKKMKM